MIARRSLAILLIASVILLSLFQAGVARAWSSPTSDLSGSQSSSNHSVTGTNGRFDIDGVPAGTFGMQAGDDGDSIAILMKLASGQPVPPGIVSYVPIDLINSKSRPVSGGTQISIAVSWADYASYLDDPVDNYAFFNGAGTLLYSWLESGTANDGSALVWVKLDSNGIAASSDCTIYLGFYALGTNVLSSSGYTGEYPTATGTYGQYDNGAKVFTLYDNFAGTTLSSQWGTTESSGGSVTVDDGVTFTLNDGSDWSFLYASSPLPSPVYVEADFVSQGGSQIPVISESTTTSMSEPANVPYYGYAYGWLPPPDLGPLDALYWVGDTESGEVASHETGFFNPGVWSLTWYATGNEYAVEGGRELYGYDSTIALPDSYYFSFGVTSNAAGNVLVRWARVRAFPPDNVLPLAFFGDVTPAPANSVYSVANMVDNDQYEIGFTAGSEDFSLVFLASGASSGTLSLYYKSTGGGSWSSGATLSESGIVSGTIYGSIGDNIGFTVTDSTPSTDGSVEVLVSKSLLFNLGGTGDQLTNVLSATFANGNGKPGNGGTIPNDLCPSTGYAGPYDLQNGSIPEFPLGLLALAVPVATIYLLMRKRGGGPSIVGGIDL